MHANPAGWFEIYVDDLPRARAFYETVLDTRLEKLPPPTPDWQDGPELWAFPMANDQPGIAGALVKMDGMTPGGNGTLIYFRCEDCAVEAGRVETAGGRIVRPKFGIGQYGCIALAADTEGNVFGLHSMR